MSKLYELVGETIAKLHNSNLLHGALDATNVMVSKNGLVDGNSIYLVGFSQSTQSDDIEDKAVDLKLFGRQK